MSQTETVEVLGVAFDNVTMDQAVDRGWALMGERRGAYVVTPNPEIVMICRSDPEAMDAVRGADLTIPDGIGVIYGAKLRKTPLKERVPGIEFTTALIERLARSGDKTLYLLGGRPGVAELARDRLTERFPGLNVVGTGDGYFREDGPVVERINAVAPDLLLVCLGAPRQEKWMRRHARELDVGLMIGAGGSMDVFAGTVERAPEAWCRANLEWLYRLKQDPRRVKRMAALPKFLLRAALERKK